MCFRMWIHRNAAKKYITEFLLRDNAGKVGGEIEFWFDALSGFVSDCQKNQFEN